MQSIRPVARIALVAVSILLAGCGSSTASGAWASAGTPAAGSGQTAPPAPAGSASGATLETPAGPTGGPTAVQTGFAFPADDIIAFYQSRGYDCVAPRPSEKAAGYAYRACAQVDANGRSLVVGVVTDPDGVLADAYASVQGKAGEDFLEPVDALDSLAGFLGVTLGEDRATDALTWLAEHLGDDYAETAVGPITLATYTPTPDDHSRLFVELANQAYLKASPPAS
jgi:hypothetical protein